MRKATTIRTEARILALLATPHTAREISETLHMHIHTAGKYVKTLRAENRVHIKSWAKFVCANPNSGHRPQPMYKIGAGKDAVYAAIPRPERDRLYQQKRKADDDRYDRYLSRLRAYNRQIKPQPELAAFFGAMRRTETESV